MSKTKLYQPLIISFLLHTCLYLLALVTPSENPLSPPTPVEVVYQTESDQKQVVIDPNLTQLNNAVKKLEDQARRLSRITQRVKRETVAPKSGPTENRRETAAAHENRTARPPRESADQMARRELQAPPPEQDIHGAQPWSRPPLGGPSAASPLGAGGDARMGSSTIADYIPEVREGGFTALNTDQFVHYTFYARINEQVRNRWISHIRSFLNQAPQTEVNRLARRTQISQVEIILDPDGNFVRAIFHQKSESPQIDRSAVAAFRDAAPLNNPPSEMVEADGYIHLRYGFYVQFRPRYMASGS